MPIFLLASRGILSGFDFFEFGELGKVCGITIESSRINRSAFDDDSTHVDVFELL